MGELRSEVVGERRVRLLVEHDGSTVLPSRYGQAPGKTLASILSRASICTAPACAIVCA